MKIKTLLLACVLASGFTYASDIPPAPVVIQKQPSKIIVMYGVSWCRACYHAREYFKNKKIRYVYFDVEKSKIGKKEWKALGGKGYPLILIDDVILYGFSTTMVGLSSDFFITIAMGTNIVMGTFAFVGALLYGATWLSRKNIKVKLPESTFVKDSWKALKDKYCLQLEFVDNNGEPLKYDTTGGYLSNIKHPWGWLVERPRMSDKTNFVSVGDNQYITEEQFRLKFPDRKIMFNTDWWSRNPDFDDKEKNVEWDVYQKEREEKQNDFEPW